MKCRKRNAQRGLKLLTGAGAMALSVAHAQTAAPAAAPQPAEQAQVIASSAQPDAPAAAPVEQVAAAAPVTAIAPAPAGEKMQTITVTGSRLVSLASDSPTPLSVVSVDSMSKMQPTMVTDVVNLMPALQGSQGATSNSGGAQRNGAASYFNLRNMGDLRTLVLVDGMRLVPTINQNQANVDSSIVPQILLKRVDIVTGGVSAVYGSDAVSGVINFITDTAFDGVKVQANYGQTTYHDDKTSDIGAAWGKRILDDKGHLEFSLQHHSDPGIFDKYNRPFYSANTGGAGAGTAASPYTNIPDQRISNTSFGGLITNIAGNGGLKDLMFTPQGTLTPFVHGASAGVANVESGGSGGYYTTNSLKSAVKFDQLFGRFDYDLTDDVHAFLEGSYSNIHTYNDYQSPNVANAKISDANPYLTSVQAPYNAILSANPGGTFTFSRLLVNEPRADQGTIGKYVIGGLDGNLGDYKWNLNGEVAQSVMRASNLYNIDNGRLYAALDAVSSGGKIVCRAALTNSAYSDCVPLNLFGQGAASQQALDYIYRRTDNINRTRMETISGSITGSPFSLWAGPVQMALSGEMRRLRWDVQSNGGPNDLANCAGIAYNCTSTGSQATRQWFFNTQGSLPVVSQRVQELAGETSVPLLKKAPLAENLELNGAARYTHYNTSGGVWTAKLGATWEINPDVTLRATRSRDIRAPNLFELYAPIQINPGTTLNDLHTGVQALVPNTQTSNPNLKPEKATTSTIGLVLTPSFIPGFSLTVDAFRIKVKDVIYLMSGRSTQAQQECENSGGTSPVCSLIIRPLAFSDRSAANTATSTYSTFLNAAALETWGTDVEVNYKAATLGHKWSVRGLVSYQPQLKYDQGPLGTIDLGNAASGVNLYPASPALKFNGMLSVDLTDRVNLSVMERWRGRMKVTAVDGLVLNHPYDPSFGTTTVNLSWKIPTADKGQYEAFVNVGNLFNKFPTVYYPGPLGSPGLGTNVPAGDDAIGRVFTVGLRAKF